MSADASVLLLNATYEPLATIDIQRAINLLYRGKAEIVERVGESLMRSERASFAMPSVVRLMYYVQARRHTVPLSKRNVVLRDDSKCQYCGVVGYAKDMTVDHVVPRSKGGESSWTNLATACFQCNQRKRNRSPQEAGMALRRRPFRPVYIPWQAVKRHTLPEEWRKYLFWNATIEERHG